MATETRLVTAGVVGRTHSLDGSFYVDRPDHAFDLGTVVRLDEHQLAEDLVGCRVEGLGAVVRVIDAPSCDLLELEGGELVPLISDAVHDVDLDARTIEIDRRFLRLGTEADG